MLLTESDDEELPPETSTSTDRLYFEDAPWFTEIVAVSQITPSGGSFATTIEVGGPLWSQDGMYTISAHQGAASSHQKSAEVEIVDGHVIPEFGVIAAMILAVAIVSIIVVTAKTRLSIVPRY